MQIFGGKILDNATVTTMDDKNISVNREKGT
jgi:hypothetical protein